MSRRRWTVAALIVVAGTLAIAWRSCSEVTSTSKPGKAPIRHRPSRGLDVAAFKQTLAIAKEKADKIRARTAARGSYEPPAVAGIVGRALMSDRCFLGPGELCRALGPTVAACDRGDGEACLVAGQYVQDTPPRSQLAFSLFRLGCKHGNAEACARSDALTSNAPVECEAAPLACSMRASRNEDVVEHGEACSAGVADSCASVLYYVDDPADQRFYLESACQLGSPMACEVLANRLRPICAQLAEDKTDCYPPDEAEARAAGEIACAAGFASACP